MPIPRTSASFDFIDEFRRVQDRVRRLELKDTPVASSGSDFGKFYYLPDNSWFAPGWSIDLANPPQVELQVNDPGTVAHGRCWWSGGIYYTGTDAGANKRNPFDDLSNFPSELWPASDSGTIYSVLPRYTTDSTHGNQPSTSPEGLLLMFNFDGQSLLFRDPETNTGGTTAMAYSLDLISYVCNGGPRDDPPRWSGATWTWDGDQNGNPI